MTSPASFPSRKPKLAYLFSRYPVISQTFCDNEIFALEKAGWEIVVCALYPPKNDLRHERLDHLRAPVLFAPPPAWQKALEQQARAAHSWPAGLVARHAASFGESLKPEHRCRNILYFADMLRTLGVGHVHIHFANRATHSALFLKELAGLPFSFTPQAQDFLVDLESPELLAEMCKEAEFVVAPCDFAREKLVELCPASAQKIIRIYNGIDPAGYVAARPSPKDQHLRLASVGRLIEFKGFHHLLRAMAAARGYGVTVELDLMGDGPWRENLVSMTKELGLEACVHFRGPVAIQEMKARFGNADAFALACTVDAKGAMDMLPTVITEAMLSRLPVISSRLAGIPEQVVDGVTGILTEPGNEKALTRALVRLAEEPGLAARMGQAGRTRAVEVFSIAVTLPELERRLEAAMQGSAAESSPSRRLAAFYDVSQPQAAETLHLESGILETSGCQIWLAGGQTPSHQAESSRLALKNVFWMPDGMAMEMEWQSRSTFRSQLETLRTELSTSIDGELFFEAARRAVWLSLQIPRISEVRGLYAFGKKASLAIWLVHRLTGIPFAIRLEREDAFEQKVRHLMNSDARSVSIQPQADPPVRSTSRRFLPERLMSWLETPGQKRRQTEQQNAFRVWLGQALANETRESTAILRHS